MNKIYIVNYYTDQNDNGSPTENDYIDIYLDYESYKEKSFYKRYPYKNIKKSGYILLDQLFMDLRHFNYKNYEFVFKCEKI